MSSAGSKEIRSALQAIVQMVEQWCHITVDDEGEPWIDSGAYSSNAAAMRVLAAHGLLAIRHQFGRRVIAKWTEAAREFGADCDFSAFREAQAKRQKGPG
jgi:hypothetical protein